MFISLILGLLLGAGVIIFAVQNIATTSVVFLVWEFEGSLALMVVLAIAVGMAISWLLSIPGAFNRRIQISRLKSNNEKLADQLTDTKVKVEEEKSKVAATNAYLDKLEKSP